jgi:hypothetical protein
MREVPKNILPRETNRRGRMEKTPFTLWDLELIFRFSLNIAFLWVSTFTNICYEIACFKCPVYDTGKATSLCERHMMKPFKCVVKHLFLYHEFGSAHSGEKRLKPF